MKSSPTNPKPYSQLRRVAPMRHTQGSHLLLFNSQRNHIKHPSPDHHTSNPLRRIKSLRSNFKFTLLVCATVLLSLTSACHSKKEAPEARKAELSIPISVATAEIKKQNITLTTAHMGSVQTAQRARIPSRLQANVDAVLVKVGQSVKQGEVLIRLDLRETKAAADQARAEMNRARADWDRYQNLLTERSVTQREADQVRAAFENAQASLKAAETRLSYASVTAPFDGIIQQVNVEAGEGVGVGQELLTIENPGLMEISTHIPLHMTTRLELGTTLSFSETQNNTQGEGTITELASVADPNTRTVAVILQITSPASLQSGDVVRVWLPSPSSQDIWIPSQAILKQGQMEYVYLVHDSKAAMRLVKSGKQQTSEHLTQILSGLKEGDVLITSPLEDLKDGRTVTP